MTPHVALQAALAIARQKPGGSAGIGLINPATSSFGLGPSGLDSGNRVQGMSRVHGQTPSASSWFVMVYHDLSWFIIISGGFLMCFLHIFYVKIWAEASKPGHRASPEQSAAEGLGN